MCHNAESFSEVYFSEVGYLLLPSRDITETFLKTTEPNRSVVFMYATLVSWIKGTCSRLGPMFVYKNYLT